MPTVYPASKAVHAPWWRALRANGLPVHPDCHWPDWPCNTPGGPEATPDLWRSHWSACIEAAHKSNVCLFVCYKGETACGQLLEAGATLASENGWVYAVSDYDFSFFHHPRCRRFNTLEAAIGAIYAREYGEKARAAA